jgi:hypothetical protein
MRWKSFWGKTQGLTDPADAILPELDEGLDDLVAERFSRVGPELLETSLRCSVANAVLEPRTAPTGARRS